MQDARTGLCIRWWTKATEPTIGTIHPAAPCLFMLSSRVLILGYLSADTYSDVVQTRLRRISSKAVINKEGCSIFTTLAMALVFSGAIEDYIHDPKVIQCEGSGRWVLWAAATVEKPLCIASAIIVGGRTYLKLAVERIKLSWGWLSVVHSQASIKRLMYITVGQVVRFLLTKPSPLPSLHVVERG